MKCDSEVEELLWTLRWAVLGPHSFPTGGPQPTRPACCFPISLSGSWLGRGTSPTVPLFLGALLGELAFQSPPSPPVTLFCGLSSSELGL